MTPAELTGKAQTHVVSLADPVCVVQSLVVEPFLAMRRAAAGAGLDLVAVSSFRSFERQREIWNAKYRGERPLLDLTGNPVNALNLEPQERIEAILRWSAIPGASRHHWGTDMDLIDRNALTAGYRVQLVAAEYAPGGPFAALNDWLGRNAARFGFFRPYRGALSAVAAEPWHISFTEIAEAAREELTPQILRDALAPAEVLGKEHVLPRLGELLARFVVQIDPP
jgi:LAS superfamily LD-carboxypeptidase LdcB